MHKLKKRQKTTFFEPDAVFPPLLSNKTYPYVILQEILVKYNYFGYTNDHDCLKKAKNSPKTAQTGLFWLFKACFGPNF
jgi:hypothetical protein